MSITPGPNNIMLSASGANFGLKKTLPHILGVNIGFGSLIFFCGLGLGIIFETFPIFRTFLKIVGSAYLLYLAYRIATASFGNEKKVKQPLNFWEAAGFQYANPKAWVMGLTLMSTSVVPQVSFVVSATIITLVVMIVNFPCITAWVVFGTAIGRFLTNRNALLVFNFVMAGLLVGTILLLM